jgi:hypothetical protein
MRGVVRESKDPPAQTGLKRARGEAREMHAVKTLEEGCRDVARQMLDAEVGEVLVNEEDNNMCADRDQDGRGRTLKGGNATADPSSNSQQRCAEKLNGRLSPNAAVSSKCRVRVDRISAAGTKTLLLKGTGGASGACLGAPGS